MQLVQAVFRVCSPADSPKSMFHMQTFQHSTGVDQLWWFLQLFKVCSSFECFYLCIEMYFIVSINFQSVVVVFSI